MSSFQYEKTLNFSFKKKKEPISAKKYLLAKDDENQKYAVFQLTNNYKETVNRIVLIINQYDKNGTFLTKNEVPYEDLAIKSNNKFVPFFKLVLDEQTERIETELVEADFEGHKYVDGRMYRVKKEKKKEKKEEEVKPKDTIDKDVKVLKSSFPLKSFLIMSAIVLLVMGIFIGIFSLSNPEIMYKDMSFNKATGAITKYYGNSKIVTIPETIQDKEVKSISNRAFINKSVVDVTIESETIKIGDYAFANNPGLVNFTAKNITEIGSYAFENCKALATVTFDDAQIVKEGAFKDCQTLQTFSARNCTSVERLAFVNCFSLKEVYVPKATLSSMVFENNDQLTQLTFGDVGTVNVVTLAMVFSNTRDHDNLVINTNITNIRTDFFKDFKYRRLNFVNPNATFASGAKEEYVKEAKAKSAFLDNGVYQKTFDVITSFNASAISDTLVINDPGVKGIYRNELLSIGRNITTLELNVNMILDNTFMSCFPNVTTLTLGNMVDVDEDTFNSMKLTSLTMPVIGKSFIKLFMFMPLSFEVVINGARDIPEKYFDGASSVTKITISGSFQKVGKYAISNCTKLKELVINSNIAELDLPIIDNKSTSLTKVTLPFIGKARSAGGRYIDLNESGIFTTKLIVRSPIALQYHAKTFENCTLLSSLTIEGGITGDATDLFKPLNSLKNLSLSGTYMQTLNMMGSAMSVNNVEYSGTSLASSFFSGWTIYNLFFTGAFHFTDTTFSNQDNISNVFVSTYCYKDANKTYKDVFDKVMLLRQINFENPNPGYTGTKPYEMGYDIYADYNRIFE